MDQTTCRWCGDECPARVGQPGWVNECAECHTAHAWEYAEPELLVAGLAQDESGTVWEPVPRKLLMRLDRGGGLGVVVQPETEFYRGRQYRQNMRGRKKSGGR